MAKLDISMGTQRIYGDSPVNEYGYDSKVLAVADVPLISANVVTQAIIILPSMTNKQQVTITSKNGSTVYPPRAGGTINGSPTLVMTAGQTRTFKATSSNTYTAS